MEWMFPKCQLKKEVMYSGKNEGMFPAPSPRIPGVPHPPPWELAPLRLAFPGPGYQEGPSRGSDRLGNPGATEHSLRGCGMTSRPGNSCIQPT